MRSRAFTLTEMLFIIGMLSVAGLLLTRLFTASQKIIDQAPAAQDRQASLEHLCQSLRRDVWAARQIELPEEQTIVLGVGDAQRDMDMQRRHSDAKSGRRGTALDGDVKVCRDIKRRWRRNLFSRAGRDAPVHQPGAGYAKGGVMKQRTRHSGFALLLAIGMMMIVAVAMLMLASAASYDGHRTFRQMRDAQVGQMLQAGAISATARLAGVPPQTGDSWLVEVPFELQSRAPGSEPP